MVVTSQTLNGNPAISVLRRCCYHGVDGMHRWVGFGVIADNLMNIATFTNARAAA